jgi:hypothetical protein
MNTEDPTCPGQAGSAFRPSCSATRLRPANSIRSDRARGHALAAVNPALPPELTDRALSYAVAVEFEPSQADALTALVPALPKESLSPYLPPELLDRAISVAAAMRNPTARSVVLKAIGPHLDERRARTAFKIAKAIRREPAMRAGAMAAVVPRLTGRDLDDGLASTVAAGLALDQLGPRAHVLAALVPCPTGGARHSVLEQAVQASLNLLHGGRWLGLATFMHAAGISCSQRPGDLIAGLEPAGEATAVRLLGAARQS